jgi:hypothetical protein
LRTARQRLRDYALTRGHVTPDCYKLGALRGEIQRDGSSDVGRRPGDHHDLAREFQIHVLDSGTPGRRKLASASKRPMCDRHGRSYIGQ